MPEISLEERQAEMRKRLAHESKNSRKRPLALEKVPPVLQVEVRGASPTLKQKEGATIIRRTDLYELVWSEPVAKLSARFGVSDVAVAKACRKYKIPLPGRGYWNRIQAGQKLKKHPLPKGEVETITFTRDQREMWEPVQSTTRISVPNTTRNLHPIAAKTYAELRAQTISKDRGRYGQNWGRTLGGGGLLNIRVTPVQLDRAIRLANAVLTAASERGYAIVDGESSRHGRGKRVEIIVQGVPLTIEIFEAVRQTKHFPTPAERRELDNGHYWKVPAYDFVSKNKLQFTLSPPRGASHDWHDTRQQKLEDMLGAVVEMMLTLSKREQEWRKNDAKEAERRMEEAQRRHEEEQRVKRLEKQLAAWKRAEEVRAYVRTVEMAIVKRCGRIDAQDELGQWLNWMRRYAERVDPSTREDLPRYPEWV